MLLYNQIYNIALYYGPLTPKRATKFIIRTDDCYADHLKKLNLLSLEKRRLLADVTFLCKAFHGIIDIYVEPYVDFRKKTDHYMLSDTILS